MATIVILGAGVMGSALTVPACSNKNQVILVGTHYDQEIIQSVKDTRFHPTLQEKLPDAVLALQYDELTEQHIARADIVVLGVSSAGIGWAVKRLSALGTPIKLLSLVTKGLEPARGAAPLTYAHTLETKLAQNGVTVSALVAIGGPCIAREIVLGQPTAVVYASDNAEARNYFASVMLTPSYRVFPSQDTVGVEACAALKNFLAIGVSAMLGRYSMPADSTALPDSAKNPVAAVFNQAVRELACLCVWIGGDRDTAFDHAGMGDLHVTVGGGRNSRLGVCLGQGMTVQQALDGPLRGLTVEGKDTASVLSPALHSAVQQGRLDRQSLPLTLAIIKALQEDTPFEFNFDALGGVKE